MPDRRVKQKIKIKYGAVSGSGNAGFNQRSSEPQPPNAPAFTLDTNPIFRHEDVEGTSVAQICWQLREWKIVHTTVQRLLDSTYSMRLRYESKYHLTEELAVEIEREWYSSCERKTEDLLRPIGGFQYVKHSKLDEFRSVIIGTPNVRQHIRDLEPTTAKSFQTLKLSIISLNTVLVEILTITDLYIVGLINLLSLEQRNE